MTIAIILVAALVFFILFILWASKSISRAIVFAVVIAVLFPFLVVIGFTVLVAIGENADSGRHHVERTKR
jgi:hypothetical protein